MGAPSAKGYEFTIMKEIMDEWNTMAETANIPGVIKLTKQRAEKLRTRLKDEFFAKNWKAAIWRIPKYKFLLGFNQRGWVATFDWFIRNESNAVAIIEGKYKAKTNANKITFEDDDVSVDEKLRSLDNPVDDSEFDDNDTLLEPW